MARQPRFFVPGEVLHVIQRGNNRGPLFASESDYRFFLNCLNQAICLHEVFVHAYVLMTNHVHLLATPRMKTSLPKREFQTAYRGPFRASVHSYANGPTYQD